MHLCCICVTTRVLVMYVRGCRGEGWNKIPTSKAENCDYIILGGSVLLKWRPSDPFAMRCAWLMCIHHDPRPGVRQVC
jgi:hypothetical protein